MDYLGEKSMKVPTKAAKKGFDCGLDGYSKSFGHEHVGIKSSEQDGLVIKEVRALGQDAA